MDPVSDDDLDAMDAFYAARGAALVVDLCPLADPGFVRWVGRRAAELEAFDRSGWGS